MRPKPRLRPRTTVRRERRTQRISNEELDDTDSSSDRDYGRTHRFYRESMNKLLPRRTYVEPQATSSSEGDREQFISEQSENPEVVSNSDGVSDEVSGPDEFPRRAPDREEGEFQTDSGEARTHTADSDQSGVQIGQRDYPMSICVPRNKPRSATKEDGDIRPRVNSKRQVKPVIRLTYDEPGKASDQPITIVHKGIIIKLGC